jgi:hypothetical protein
VVERAEHQDSIGALVIEWQVAGVSDEGFNTPGLSLSHVFGNWIQQGYAIAATLQPLRIPAWAAADVEHAGRRGRQPSIEKLECPFPFHAVACIGHASVFVAGFVDRHETVHLRKFGLVLHGGPPVGSR